MTKCKGIMGRVFGHMFESYLIYKSATVANLNGWGVSEDHLETMAEKYRDKKYAILCKRCGEQKGANNE